MTASAVRIIDLGRSVDTILTVRRSNRRVFLRFPSDHPLRKSFFPKRLYGFEPVNALPYHGIAEAGNLHLPQTVEELDGCLRARERIFPMPVTNEVSLTKSGGTRCQEY